MHIVGFISWFAGLFYIVRLFVYHVEANDRPEQEKRILQSQFEIMQTRLWTIITRPAMIVTLCCGLTMVVFLWPVEPWLHWKFLLLAGLIGYHVVCGRILRQQHEKTSTWTSSQLRMFNEIATMLMFAIVFLAVFKSAMSALYGALGLLLLGTLLSLGIRAYRRTLERAEKAPA